MCYLHLIRLDGQKLQLLVQGHYWRVFKDLGYLVKNMGVIVFLAEEQPLPAAASPTAQLPDYVPESDPEADLEEDDNEEPVDYPADGGDDDDDEDESSEDDEDDMDVKANDDEEEEHPTPADSVVVALPAADQAPSREETKPFETDESAATPPPHPAYRVTARISIPAQCLTPRMGRCKG
ncbi:hypothetical protein Tco_0016294 [Tanacetum coccineum]